MRIGRGSRRRAFNSTRFAGAVAVASGAVLAVPAQAQQAATPAPSTANAFRMERFAEDWSGMADEAARTRSWHRLKWIKLGDASLTLGGDLRLRTEFVDAPMFGATGARADGYLMRRAMVHGDLRFRPGLRVFAQVSHHRAFGRRLPFPLDRNGLELQQAFVDVGHAWSTGSIGARAGRQEMIFSPRFLHPREATNIRSAFDGVRGWAQHRAWRLEGFVMHPVQNRPGSFDDRGNPAERFDGVRLTRSMGAGGAWRVTGSWYRHQRDAFRLGVASGPDDRTSWGLRVAGRQGAFDFDAEHYVQTGQFAGRKIRAFGGAGEGGYNFGGALRTRAGMRWQYGSGDADAADGTAGTFAGAFPRPPCCIDPLWLAPSNLGVLSPFAQVAPHRDVTIEAKADLVRRFRKTDAIYAFPQTAYPRSVGQEGDTLGLAGGITVTWNPASEVSLSVQHLEQRAQGALAKSGAREGSYTAAILAFRF